MCSVSLARSNGSLTAIRQLRNKCCNKSLNFANSRSFRRSCAIAGRRNRPIIHQQQQQQQQSHLVRKVSKRLLLQTRQQHSASIPKEEIPQPSARDLQLVALNVGVPFIGFGIMDNAILIMAGDAIDVSLGVAFNISTLCAAALGNISEYLY